jgi:hypothetical protein
MSTQTTVWKCMDGGHTGINEHGGCATCGSQAVFIEQIPVVPVVETERK